MPVQKISGKAGYFKTGGSAGTKMNITKWSGSLEVKNSDTTDSNDFDASTNLVWNTQVPASAKMTIDVEGNYDVNGAQAPLVTAALNGASPLVIAELGFTATAVFGYGNFNVTNFKADSPMEDTVTYSATLTSNGKWNNGVSAP
jgi:hypothetical protein